MKSIVKDYIKGMPVIVLGNLCIALSTACFVIPNKILVGGVAGVAVILNSFLGIGEELIITVLIYGLFVIGMIVLGKSFTVNTLISTVIYPILLAIVTSIFKVLPSTLFEVDILVASLCSGVLTGLGVGLVYQKNGSTGGMDIIPLIIHKYTHVSLSVLVLIVDGLTVLFGVVTYNIEAAIYGVISVVICSYVINQTMLMGSKKLKQVMIMSHQIDKINKVISEKLDCGCTLIKSKGGYTKEEKDMLMVVLNIKKYPILIDCIHSIDETAFIIVSDINEVKGRGFTLESQYL